MQKLARYLEEKWVDEHMVPEETGLRIFDDTRLERLDVRYMGVEGDYLLFRRGIVEGKISLNIWGQFVWLTKEEADEEGL